MQAEQKSKKAAEQFSGAIEKFNRVGGDFEQKMSDSAQVSSSESGALLQSTAILPVGSAQVLSELHTHSPNSPRRAEPPAPWKPSPRKRRTDSDIIIMSSVSFF